MMADAEIKDEKLTQIQLDLMFAKENKHRCNMSFETFLNLLFQISQIKYQNKSPNKNLL
jgi:hypothetical protein